MANNRMYILDTETNEVFPLAKAWGEGWKLSDYFNKKKFEKWLKNRDFSGAYGGTGKSTLILIFENDEYFDKWLEGGMKIWQPNTQTK